ncbi:4368_t:CDS:2 [Funneliformis geosporum]|uniref:4368_t:CDS:1 n=1 Tax=Funneliformis geosporum TaxID=1117311 RepID=A0A9W4STC3_9GLOM|nr:4368_t:CDS:2 [Funneliformis geosporum]
MDLELRFHEISLPKKANGKPIFSISKHGWPYHSGTNAIHLMENGLKDSEKATKDVEKVTEEESENATEEYSEITSKVIEKVTEEIIKKPLKIPHSYQPHALKLACIAMEYLYKRRDEPVGTRNLTKYKDLVALQKVLLRHSIPLLHHILFDYKQADGSKQDKTRVNRYLHITREFEWPKSESAKTKEIDLMLTIKLISSGHHKVIDAIQIMRKMIRESEKFIIKEHSVTIGWMFAVTKALNNRNFVFKGTFTHYVVCIPHKYYLSMQYFTNHALDPKKNM